MALHVTGFFENQDGAGAEQNLAALVDTLSQLFPVQATDFLRVHDKLRWINGAYVALETAVAPRARLRSESIAKRYSRDGISLPAINGAAGTTNIAEPLNPPLFNDFRECPIETQAGENLEALTLNNPTTAADQFVLLWMADGQIRPVDPAGGFWTRWTTVASAMTANAWNTRALTPDVNLLTGEYEVLGLDVVGVSLIAARLDFPDQSEKPGVVARDAATDFMLPTFKPGQWGPLGRFHTNNPPALHALPDLADNEVQDVRLFVRPV